MVTATEEAKDGEVPAQVISQPAGAMVQDPNCAKALGAPIPGYSGISRRVQADNIFGMTGYSCHSLSLGDDIAVQSSSGWLGEMTWFLAA